MDNIEAVIFQLLTYFDENPTRTGLSETPKRFKDFMEEFLGTSRTPLKVKTLPSEGYDEMVIQTRIPFYSICEHHLLPFFGYGTIAYIPGKSIIGLSHLPHVLDHVSHKLQTQERVTVEVADYLNKTISPKGVGVILSARHLCQEMRGVQKAEALTITSCLRGSFKSDSRTRAEFMHLSGMEV